MYEVLRFSWICSSHSSMKHGDLYRVLYMLGILTEPLSRQDLRNLPWTGQDAKAGVTEDICLARGRVLELRLREHHGPCRVVVYEQCARGKPVWLSLAWKAWRPNLSTNRRSASYYNTRTQSWGGDHKLMSPWLLQDHQR